MPGTWPVTNHIEVSVALSWSCDSMPKPRVTEADLPSAVLWNNIDYLLHTVLNAFVVIQVQLVNGPVHKLSSVSDSQQRYGAQDSMGPKGRVVSSDL